MRATDAASCRTVWENNRQGDTGKDAVVTLCDRLG